MNLFEKNQVSEYIGGICNKIENEISSLSNQEILSCDIDELREYYQSKYLIDPISLGEDNIEINFVDKKIRIYNQFYKTGSYEPQYYEVDGYLISFKIPFDGDSNLLYLKPSTRLLSKFPVSEVVNPHDDFWGYIVVAFEKTNADLKSHADSLEKYVLEQFEEKFKSYRQMIKYVNIDIDHFNNGLGDFILTHLKKRKERASDFVMFSRALNIPLQLSPNAPKITNLPLKRIIKKSPAKPKPKEVDPEYGISNEDFTNIINIIHSVCSSMEATARTFNKIEEEELRDFIVATLSTHYGKLVSGETFRKNGKTDIIIMFDNKAAFIGECKIWHGISLFSKAIDQLFGYVTWRDFKTSLIIFNKENKDFHSICDTIEKWISENTKQYKVIDKNMWECIIHRKENNSDIKLTIAIYDLSL